MSGGVVFSAAVGLSEGLVRGWPLRHARYGDFVAALGLGGYFMRLRLAAAAGLLCILLTACA
jgi:hypothetical protein